jgi:proline-specific peptidase
VTRSTEGTVAFRGFRTWYRIEGDLAAPDGRLPLLVLHGGPGVPHDYLEDLAVLADGGRPVIFYDQIGSGRSDHPDDPELWVMSTFVEEVGAVRDGLGLDRVHLFGHSWGGWLALEYAIGRPGGLASLILAGTCASMPAFAAETRRLKETLPAAVQAVLDRHEAEGTTHEPAYQEAAMTYYSQWLLRLQPWPDHVIRTFAGVNAEIYGTMQGPEWNVTGNLKDWDVTDRLGELHLPVLVTSGRHDEMTPALVRPLAEGLPNAEWVVFEDSAHFTTVEEPERYRETLESFLTRVEAGDG